MSHVRTRPYYPQSNGKIGRYHRTLNSDYTCQRTPLSQDDARQVVTEFVEDYNAERLHAALGYITPLDMLQGRQGQIHEERDRKIAEARNKRAAARAKLRESRQQAG
ncbi:MAG: integrase core domain-containing protein [Planctomycetota bacterium]